MTTQLQELTQKIHKHCPELLELSFGCAIKAKEYQEVKEVVFISKGAYKTDGGFRLFAVEKQDETIVEILGHPITLEHVLKAFNGTKFGLKWHTQAVYFVESLGTGYDKFSMEWQLTKPLSEQSPETIKWLNEIIV